MRNFRPVLARFLLYFYTAVEFIQSQSDYDTYQNADHIDDAGRGVGEAFKGDDHDGCCNDNTDNPVESNGVMVIKKGVDSLGPVSYTHLDVYKRQRWEPPPSL